NKKNETLLNQPEAVSENHSLRLLQSKSFDLPALSYLSPLSKMVVVASSILMIQCRLLVHQKSPLRLGKKPFLINVAMNLTGDRNTPTHILPSLSLFRRLTGEDYSVQVNLSDYLDILCPHYPEQLYSAPVETLALYLVAEHQFRGCVETKEAIKRWECNQPDAPYGPVRFSEKIQRFTPFSLGFEFLPGHHYYYSSLSTDDGPPLPCMKLRVTVCCPPSNNSWIIEARSHRETVPWQFCEPWDSRCSVSAHHIGFAALSLTPVSASHRAGLTAGGGQVEGN
ncbi:hypothetical protein DNTS_009930, partial [Danionella cerebrum]